MPTSSDTSQEHVMKPHPHLAGWEKCTTCGYMRPITYAQKYTPTRLKEETKNIFGPLGYQGITEDGKVKLCGSFTIEDLQSIVDSAEEIVLVEQHR